MPPELEALAEGLIGKPYAEGGADPERGFSCVGLAIWLYGRHGLQLPADYLAFCARFRQVEHPEPMDLVMMRSVPGLPDVATHLGVYLGRHRFIQALDACGVGIAQVDAEPWRRRIICFMRLNGARPWARERA